MVVKGDMRRTRTTSINGKYRIRYPVNLTVVCKKDVDQVDSLRHRPHCDAIYVFREKDTFYIVIIEETGVPEPRDLDKLRVCEEYLSEIVDKGGSPLIIKILHHKGGVHRNIVSLIRRYFIEIQRCGNEIRFDRIYYRRFCTR